MLEEEAVLQRIMESGAFDALRKQLITQLKQNVIPFDIFCCESLVK